MQDAITRDGHEYYNCTMAARYVNMPYTTFKRRIKRLANEQGIVIPMMIFKRQEKLIDKRVLDQLRKPMIVGKEHKWYEELKRIIQTIESER